MQVLEKVQIYNKHEQEILHYRAFRLYPVKSRLLK